jgi:hypothetical protein
MNIIQGGHTMLLHEFRSSSRVAALLFLLAGLGGAALEGQPAYLVRDIKTTPGAGALGWVSLPYGFSWPPRLWAEHEGILLFSADDGVTGSEL